MENDRDFAQIEKRKKTAEVFVPDDWVHIIEKNKLKETLCGNKDATGGLPRLEALYGGTL